MDYSNTSPIIRVLHTLVSFSLSNILLKLVTSLSKNYLCCWFFSNHWLYSVTVLTCFFSSQENISFETRYKDKNQNFRIHCTEYCYLSISLSLIWGSFLPVEPSDSSTSDKLHLWIVIKSYLMLIRRRVEHSKTMFSINNVPVTILIAGYVHFRFVLQVWLWC